MPILKKNELPFVQIPNETAQDKTLSLEALGALTRLCSNADNYKFKVEWLQANWGIGRDRVRAILRELRAKGYLKIVPKRTDDGSAFDGQEWHISTLPVYQETDSQSDGFSVGLKISRTEFQECIKKELKDKKELKETNTNVRVREEVNAEAPRFIRPKQTTSSPPPLRTIPVNEATAAETAYHAQVFDSLEQYNLVSPFNHNDWIVSVDYAFRRGVSAANYAACILSLINATWRKSPVTPKMVTNQLPNFQTPPDNQPKRKTAREYRAEADAIVAKELGLTV